MQVTSETSMQVKVQHDENVHLAACSEEVCNSSQKVCCMFTLMLVYHVLLLEVEMSRVAYAI